MSQELSAPVRSRSLARILSLVIAGGGLIVLGALALAYLFWSEAGASNVPGGYESAIPLAVDYPAPKLSLVDLDKRDVSLADYTGQVVLVNNWAFWCPPCRAELPILERYYQDHHAQGFTIIGIESGSSAQTVRQYVEQYKLTYPIWLDPRIKAVAAFGNRSLPNSYVIDGVGQVRLGWTGPISREMLEKYVTPLLEK
jgi:thiol-disulfide isomerase/thioredoxin